MQVRFSQLAVSRLECANYIRKQLLQRDRLPLNPLYKMKFVTMSDISTPTSQILIGRLVFHDEDMRYILSSTQGRVVMHLSMRSETTRLSDMDISRTITTQMMLPLSMDKRTPDTIHIPSHFSKEPSTIPNEVTWEFLNQVYSPARFPIL